jgi:hypothetical protein
VVPFYTALLNLPTSIMKIEIATIIKESNCYVGELEDR